MADLDPLDLDPPGPDGPPDRGGRDGPRRWVDELRRRAALDVRLVAWVGVAVVAAVAAWWSLRPAPTPLEEAIPRASTSASAPAQGGDGAAAGSIGASAPGPGGGDTSTTGPSELVVHAAGAVVRPGVYRLAPGGRVEDVVRAAGGLAPDADPGRINLAAPVADGDRLYVPRRGEEEPPPVVGPDGAPPDAAASPGAGPGVSGDGPATLIDLNAATEAELDELPGVGPATAAAIVAHRTENGPFRSVDDLIDVRGIGEAKLEQIRPLVTV